MSSNSSSVASGKKDRVHARFLPTPVDKSPRQMDLKKDYPVAAIRAALTSSRMLAMWISRCRVEDNPNLGDQAKVRLASLNSVVAGTIVYDRATLTVASAIHLMWIMAS